MTPKTAVVFTKKVKGPATHAIVIGAGHYFHLPGGAAKSKFKNPEGMGQLVSPPHSARAVARWLIEEYQSDDRPLATVALLTSEKKTEPFQYQPRGSKKPISVAAPQATMPAVRQAISDWHALGNTNPEHLLLFFFCGHGIAAGTELALLLSDFGAKPHAPLDGALDFRKFHSNMDECAARQQCYFVDACRVGSDLLRRNGGFAGDPVIQATGTFTSPNGQLRQGPIFYSTLADAQAYARPGELSVFTDALLQGFRGAGSGDELGPWQVRTTRLLGALDFLMREAGKKLKLPQSQIPSSNSFGEFALNTLDNPKVPVMLCVLPPKAHALAALRYKNSARKQKKRRPGKEPWYFTIATGTYSFYADFKNGKYKAEPITNEIVRPPYWGKPLKARP
jgi:hypothetical protein